MSVMSQCYSVIIDSGIITPGHVKEVINSLNDIDKRYKYQLMYNVKLTRSICFYSHILMNSCTQKNDVRLDKEFQKHLSKEHRKHVVIYQGKYSKRSSKRKWTDREYHVQYNADVAHKEVKIY